MRKNEMITIQMSKEEAKEFSSAMMGAIDKVEEMYETLDELFDLLSPIIMFADYEEPFQKEPAEREAEEDLCEKCELPCDQKLDKEVPKETAEESEEEVLAIELLKAVFSALTDLIENGE